MLRGGETPRELEEQLLLGTGRREGGCRWLRPAVSREEKLPLQPPVKAMRRGGAQSGEQDQQEQEPEQQAWPGGEVTLGSQRPATATAAGPEEEEKLEREHFRRIVNAFRYYG